MRGSNSFTLPENLFTKTLSAVIADKESHKFLVGTNSFKNENQVYVLAYSEDQNRIDQEAVYSMTSGEIWSLQASPYNRNHLACGVQSSKDHTHSVMILEMKPGDLEEGGSGRKSLGRGFLKAKAELFEGDHQFNIHSLCWEDVEEAEGQAPKELVSADKEKIVVWDLKQSQMKEKIEPAKFISAGALESLS